MSGQKFEKCKNCKHDIVIINGISKHFHKHFMDISCHECQCNKPESMLESKLVTRNQDQYDCKCGHSKAEHKPTLLSTIGITDHGTKCKNCTCKKYNADKKHIIGNVSDRREP